MAYGITTRELAKALETAGIRHLKHTLHVGVNVKDKDDVPHDGISVARPQALYLVPVVRTITTQALFKGQHLSEHKLKNLGVSTLMEQRRAAGLPAHVAHTPSTEDGRKHDGGKQPKKHVCMDDDNFVERLMASGSLLTSLTTLLQLAQAVDRSLAST